MQVDAELIQGRGGIFEVSVHGTVVAKKTYNGFPTEDQIVDAVRAAL